MRTVSSWYSRLCPQPPDWEISWAENFLPLAWIQPMIGCPQDPVHHAEGDVETHVRLVCQQLTALAGWREKTDEERAAIFLGAALHDVAKPACTVIGEDGRITSAGHGQKGAQMARCLLWRGDGFRHDPAPLHLREMISSMVRYSSLPLWLWDKEQPRRSVIRASQSVPLDWLALLAEADARGRTCQDLDDLLARIRLFLDFAAEQNCLSAPFEFASAHSRFLYFHKHADSNNDEPPRDAYDDTRFEVTLMSGLPGAGKDRWIATNNADSLPVISLDAIRSSLRIEPDEDQAPVISAAREQARKFMRAGQSFIWNGTNVTRYMRDPLIRFFRDYDARIKITYVEPPTYSDLLSRNNSRDAAVPEHVIERLADKLEVPDFSEAHTVEWITQ